MKMLLAGGGTGGHVFPAVALAETLLAEEPGSEVLFVGTRRGLEFRVIPELGYRLETIDIGGLANKSLWGKIRMIPNLIGSLRKSLKILKEFQPDVVVGVGGYASGPLMLAAQLRKYPILLHEQNAWPGWTNRILSRWASRVCLSFSEADAAFHRGRTVLTGNPLRQGMESCPPVPEGEPVLLVFGGSQGARAINRSLINALPQMEKLRGKMRIIHQTGEADLDEVRRGYRDAGWDDSGIVTFIDDMAAAYSQAHLVLCRAGATTIAELTACGRPSVLVPYPFAANDHQTANALALARKGAAMLLPQKELNPERLATLLTESLMDRDLLVSMGRSARALGRPGAAGRILKECRAISGKDI